MSDMAPDPATNTAPPPVSELALKENTSWDYLDKPDRTMEDEAPSEWPDEHEDEAKPQEKKPDDTKPTAEAKTETEVEAEAKTDEKTAEISSEMKQKLELFDEFDKSIREDAPGVAKALFDGLDARQKAAFLKDVGVAEQHYPEFNVDEYEPGSSEEMEKDLKARYADIRSIPQLIKETRDMDGRIGEARETLAKDITALHPHISQAAVMSELALAKIDALCEAMGMQLPDPDFEAVGKEIKPNVTYRDAVRKSINYGTAIEMAKQAGTKRPKDIVTTKRETTKFSADEDDLAVKIARQQGTLRRR